GAGFEELLHATRTRRVILRMHLHAASARPRHLAGIWSPPVPGGADPAVPRHASVPGRVVRRVDLPERSCRVDRMIHRWLVIAAVTLAAPAAFADRAVTGSVVGDATGLPGAGALVPAGGGGAGAAPQGPVPN